ncbi:signal recognition particle-docking protein FtsY [Streptococcus sciuri]|uniref:Signal recognition particle receptor FtsY n=1 Tax=Streptococcus sciuri TaxID=2973939 RepID=A0ABT2F7B9_9STRE|nr:signal recognition particle-docking protein FtsY [Streptococcus sciuri]MCS4488329.1 signal recognition particle-docking protein FtsY [Streptococcus sciuri]
MGLFDRLFGRKKENESEVVGVDDSKKKTSNLEDDDSKDKETYLGNDVMENNTSEVKDTVADLENVTTSDQPTASEDLGKGKKSTENSDSKQERTELVTDVATSRAKTTAVSQTEQDFMANYYAKRTTIEKNLTEETLDFSKHDDAKDKTKESDVIETSEEKYNRSLKKTRTGFGARLNAFLANFRRVDEDFFEELEELLILSDVGVNVATQLTEDLRYEAKLENAKKSDELRHLIIEKLVDIYEKDGVYNESVHFQDGLTVMLFVGVNGVGKTTSIGKLAYKYKQEGKRVMLVAADTFRAGAVAQLLEWGHRVDVPVVTGSEKADPASVVFDGMEKAVAENVDILLIDTAGRLQNKDHLMAELEKIGRIIKRVVPDAPHETLLALDASTGQNALSQAKEFSKITPLTGIILTKIDGTAKGGVVLAIRQDLSIPVKYIGFGEKIDDIGEFRSEDFIRSLLSDII